MTGEALFHEDPAQVGVAVELDPEHVIRFPFAPVRGHPDSGEARDVRVELSAARPQHHEDLRHGAAHEGDGPQLDAGVHSGVHRVQVAARSGIVADERRDLNEIVAVDVDDEHVVEDPHAGHLLELARHIGANRLEIDGRPRSAQYQFSASFFHA